MLAMRPYPAEIPVQSLLGPIPPVGEPEIRAVFISTLAGSASTGGSTQHLGNATDTALLLGARQWSDVVLVGAQTVRTENYGPALGTVKEQAVRRSRGQSTAPVLAVITRSLNLDPSSRLFSNPEHPPMLLTPEASLTAPSMAERRQRLEKAGAELVSTGPGSPTDIMAALHGRGLLQISCEGGPGILGMMLSADLIDVLHLTLEPLVHAPVEQPLVHLPADARPFARRLELEDVQATADSSLFLRYRRRR